MSTRLDNNKSVTADWHKQFAAFAPSQTRPAGAPLTVIKRQIAFEGFPHLLTGTTVPAAS